VGEAVKVVKVVQEGSLLWADKAVMAVWPLFVHARSFLETVVLVDKAGKAVRVVGAVKADRALMVAEEVP
jgi:hypothetical protein